MAWTTLLDSVLAHKKPVTLQILRALRDNIVSVAQGLTGAPRVQPRALATYAGRADLPTAGTPVAFVNLDVAAILLVELVAFKSSEAATLSIVVAGSADGGSTWGGDVVVATAGTSSVQGSVQFNLGAGTLVGASTTLAAASLGATNINALRFRAASTGAGTQIARVLLHYAGEAP